MAGKVQGYLDENGEVRNDLAIIGIQKAVSNGFTCGWFALSQDGSLWLSKEGRKMGLTGRDYEVLLCLMAYLDFENYLTIKQKDLASELDMRPSHLNRTLKKLIKMGVLVEGEKVGQHWSYRLNPHIGWRGRGSNHHPAMRAHPNGLKVIDGGGSRDERQIDWVGE